MNSKTGLRNFIKENINNIKKYDKKGLEAENKRLVAENKRLVSQNEDLVAKNEDLVAQNEDLNQRLENIRKFKSAVKKNKNIINNSKKHPRNTRKKVYMGNDKPTLNAPGPPTLSRKTSRRNVQPTMQRQDTFDRYLNID